MHILKVGLLIRSKNTAVFDSWRLGSGAGLGATCLKRLNGIDPIDDLAENYMLAIKMRRRAEGDKELGAVCVRAGVGHGELVFLAVIEAEVLVGKRSSVDGFSARAVAAREVSSLSHEAGNDSVEHATLVAKRGAVGSCAGCSLGKRCEVLDGLRHCVAVQANDDSPGILSVNLEVEEDFLGDRVDCPDNGRRSGEHLAGRSVRVDVRLCWGRRCALVGGVHGSAECIRMSVGAKASWSSWFFRNNWIFKNA